MKKLYLYLLIATHVLFVACKKDKEPDPVKTLNDDLFLKSVKVAGAREVSIDTTRNYIQIVLPKRSPPKLLT